MSFRHWRLSSLTFDLVRNDQNSKQFSNTLLTTTTHFQKQKSSTGLITFLLKFYSTGKPGYFEILAVWFFTFSTLTHTHTLDFSSRDSARCSLLNPATSPTAHSAICARRSALFTDNRLRRREACDLHRREGRGSHLNREKDRYS